MSVSRGLLLAAATLAGVATVSAVPAAAASPEVASGGVVAAVRGDDPLAPVLLLTNHGESACQVAATSLGTVAFTSVAQGGAEVVPILFDVTFSESLDWSLQERLHTLEPGESLELSLRVVPTGPTGQALETVAWSATLGSTGALYPIEADAPLRLQLRYDVPADPGQGPPICGAADSTAAELTAAGSSLPWVALAVAGAVLAAAAVVIILFVRSRRRAAASLVLALLAVAAVPLIWPPRPADATVNVHDDLADAYAACLASFTMEGGDPAGILPTLNGPGLDVNILPAGGDETHHGGFPDNLHIIWWDPDPDGDYFGSGGARDGCSALYHEMFHAYDEQQGTIDNSMCGTSGIPKSEVAATRAQNQLREKLGLPPRTHYGDKPLPSGDCDEPPPDPQCLGDGCGDSHGDPHLRTFDGQRWSFQAVGEFVTTRNPAGGFEVQTRQEPVAQSRRVSVNTAVAMDVAGDTVQVAQAGRTGVAQHELTLMINGTPRPIGPVRLPAGGEVELADGLRGPIVVVSWPDGSVATAIAVGRGGIRITVEPAPDHAGALEGLLGDFDGDPANDVGPAGGQPLAELEFDLLYPELADSWRVDEQTSLFTYAPGTGPQTYADRSFPDADVAVDELPNREAAEALCRRAGVSDPQVLATCTLDVALTGQADFAAAAAASQAFVAAVPSEVPPPTEGAVEPGETVTLRVSQPNASARVTFDAESGQKVFIDVPSTTLPNACGLLRLLGPDGASVATGCVIDGEGFVDGVVLPRSGDYTLVLDPPRDDTGQAQVQVLFIADQREQIEPDGPPLTASIAQPGVVAQLSFDGTAGQKVYVDVPSTSLPNECDPLRLVGPGGVSVAAGCVINGDGHVETVTLPATGTYVVEVDPRGRVTGEASVRVYLTSDQVGSLGIGGAAMTATIAQPGDEAHFTFTGSAGATVRIEVPSSTLPNQCGVLDLITPDGESVETGCIVSGRGDIGGDDGVVLPAAGEYTVIVDPSDRGTGTATLRLRS